MLIQHAAYLFRLEKLKKGPLVAQLKAMLTGIPRGGGSVSAGFKLFRKALFHHGGAAFGVYRAPYVKEVIFHYVPHGVAYVVEGGQGSHKAGDVFRPIAYAGHHTPREACAVFKGDTVFAYGVNLEYLIYGGDGYLIRHVCLCLIHAVAVFGGDGGKVNACVLFHAEGYLIHGAGVKGHPEYLSFTVHGISSVNVFISC